MNNNKIITLPKRKEGRNISKNEDEHCPIFDGQDRRVEKIVTNRLRLDGEFKGEANHDRRESEVNDDSSGNNDLDQDFENEEDAQSMESVVALVAGTSPEISPPQTPVLSPAKPLIMSAPQNQKSRCRNFQNFTATLIDTFEFPFFGDRRYTSKNTFHWRGLDWNIFASLDGTKGLGFFIGSDVWKNISSDWSIHIRYKFEVLGDDDRVLLSKCFIFFCFIGNLSKLLNMFEHTYIYI